MIYTRGTWKVDFETGEIVANDNMILGQIYGARTLNWEIEQANITIKLEE